MLKDSIAFGSFTCTDLNRTRAFYENTLGLDVRENPMGLLELHFGQENRIFMIYPGANHQPAVFTVLNFAVDDVEKEVDDLIEKGLKMERYEHFKHDEKGIVRGDEGPPIAWFKDPDGNILSIVEHRQQGAY